MRTEQNVGTVRVLAMNPVTGRIVGANEAACRDLERERDELVASFVEDLFPGIAPWDATLRAGSGATLTTVRQGRSGQQLDVQLEAIALGDAAGDAARDTTSGSMLLVWETIDPKSDFKAAPAAERAATQDAEAALDTLTYNLSHDLQAPLRAIRGFAQMLGDTNAKLDRDHRRFIDLIIANTDHMRALVEGLRRFHELSKLTPRQARVDMAAVAAHVVDVQRGREPGREVEISIGSMPAAQGDPDRLREVWEALVDNALKFTRHTPQARIEIGHEPETGAWFVRDNGAGFDTQRAGRLFMLFQRLHSADDYPGGGIGLALARRIVERHGGRMWAEARPDEGATFRFTLPD